MVRLDKYLADAGLGSRTQVREKIRKKQVLVNGVPAQKPEEKIDPENDQVFFQGSRVIFQPLHYYMLNKPAGLVSATTDRREKTVLDLLEDAPGKNLFPVGRLDKDTTGLLLITDDGPLAHRLLSPRHHVDKTYLVTAEGKMTPGDLEHLENGVDIGEARPTLPAKAELLKTDGAVSEVRLTIREGKFHQVKRMFAAVGKPVLSLKRIAMGGLLLDESLAEGAYRPLTEAEVRILAGQKGRIPNSFSDGD